MKIPKARIPQHLDRIHDSKSTPVWFSVYVENFLAYVRGKDVHFEYDRDKQLIRVKEQSTSYYFLNRSRGFTLYRNGLKARGEFLFKSYCLQNVSFAQSDVVIDCGANSGDLFLEMESRILEMNYIAIEPSLKDFNILQLNVKNATLLNIALGEENGEVDFYLSTAGADSSLIEPKNWTEKTKSKVRRLDSLLAEMAIKKVKLVKIEAEGFEPDVLYGLTGALKYIEFIAVDGGPERGKFECQTFSDCSNFLITNGFKMIDTYLPWNRALFKNTLIE
jgi:FkbM family methyltransferase